MKHVRKWIVCSLCVMLLGLTACGRNDVNDATNGNAGTAVEDGMKDMGEGIRDTADDLTNGADEKTRNH